MASLDDKLKQKHENPKSEILQEYEQMQNQYDQKVKQMSIPEQILVLEKIKEVPYSSR
jgi:hypothetical protein